MFTRAVSVRARSIGIALALALTACATTHQAEYRGALRGKGAIVEIRNENFDDLVIYLIRSGTPIPLGIAPGLSRRTLPVKSGELDTGDAVALAAGKRGGPIQRITSRFELAPGRIASWHILAGDAVEQPIVRQ